MRATRELNGVIQQENVRRGGRQAAEHAVVVRAGRGLKELERETMWGVVREGWLWWM